MSGGAAAIASICRVPSHDRSTLTAVPVRRYPDTVPHLPFSICQMLFTHRLSSSRPPRPAENLGQKTSFTS